MPELCSNTVNIVLNGDFNPSIFQPAWFSAQKLISELEAAAPQQLVISADIATFTLPWLNLRVIQHQFVASTTKESHFPALRDLVVGTFKLLHHTPVRQMGINLEHHYRFESEAKWNGFGHTLVPKEGTWKKVMRDPGLLSITMLDKVPREHPPGHVHLIVQSSTVVKPGVSCQVNNHFECSSQPAPGASGMLKILQELFDSSIKSSDDMIKTLLSVA